MNYSSKLKAAELNRRIEVWGKIPTENELGADDFLPGKIKTIWAGIIPQTGKLQNQSNTNTVVSNTTHKIKVRFNSGKDIKNDNWIMYFENKADSDTYAEACAKNQDAKVGHRFDINYILDPFLAHETLELFCTEKIE